MPSSGIGSERLYKLTIKFESKISLFDLENALLGNSLIVPKNAVQALDIIFRHFPSMK